VADWIANPNNPLTASRLCESYLAPSFGDGIVRTTDNFGRGELPTHPELLDYLAARLWKAAGRPRS
jgi:hypothetical protein